MPAYTTTRSWHGLDFSWMFYGACVDREDTKFVVPSKAEGEPDQIKSIFFDELGRSLEAKMRTTEARRICTQECQARQACLDFALASDMEGGIWGGLDGEQRRQILKERRRLVRSSTTVMVRTTVTTC